jgi:hypothetical protein
MSSFIWIRSGPEREGALVFAHGDEAETIELSADDLDADTVAAPFGARADVAEAPIEARVRFLDVAKDYLIGAVSVRRRDAATGGVEMIDAPLALDETQAEALAQALLAARRAGSETAQIGLGPAHLALEPGDRVLLNGQTFHVARIEDGRGRQLDLQRVDALARAPLAGAVPGAPADPVLAPTPTLAILDLPPLPGFEDDERPLAAVAATPWAGAHRIYVGGDAASATARGEARDPAAMGELLWDLYPGPIGRWDSGNIVRVRLYGGALASVSKAEALAGANLFAVEGDDGEWELLQAQQALLVGPGEYELSGILRGLGDSGHAMGAPTPAGRRIVKIDTRLTRVSMNPHEWGGSLAFIAPRAGRPATDADAASTVLALTHVAQRPFRPVHVRAARGAGGDVAVAWVRQSRLGGLAWSAGEPPLGEPSERYQIEILNAAGAVVLRTAETSAPTYLYSAADQIADFGALPASLRLRVAQIGANGLPGLKTESTNPL